MIVINYGAVLFAAIAIMVFGALWYSPLLFGNVWMKMMGLSMKDMEKAKQQGMGKTYLIAFVSQLVLAYVMAHFANYFDADTWWEGLQLGFWAWLGFVATFTSGSVLWEGKSWKLYALNNAYNLIGLLIAGSIIAVLAA